MLSEAAMAGKLDAEHTKYLHLLAGARRTAEDSALQAADAAAGLKRKRDARADEEEDEEEDVDDESSDDSDDVEASGDDGFDNEEGSEQEVPNEARPGSGSGRAGAAASQARRTADRWFSRPEFADALADEDAEAAGLSLPAGPATGKAKAGALDDDYSDDDDDDGHGSDDGSELGAGSDAVAAAPTNSNVGNAKPKSNPRTKSTLSLAELGGPSEDVDSEGEADPLRNVPKSDRQRRKDKLRKEREKKAKAAARREARDAADSAGFEIVAGTTAAAADADDEFERVAQVCMYGVALVLRRCLYLTVS